MRTSPTVLRTIRARVEAADLPDEVRKAALREVGKLERASDQSPESGWIRTWLDTVLELPWNTKTDSTDITAAREVLDADHHGLEDVKIGSWNTSRFAPAARNADWRLSAVVVQAR